MAELFINAAPDQIQLRLDTPSSDSIRHAEREGISFGMCGTAETVLMRHPCGLRGDTWRRYLYSVGKHSCSRWCCGGSPEAWALEWATIGC